MVDQLCLKIDSIENGVLSFSVYERLPNTLRISATDKSGRTSETVTDLSCLSPNMSLDVQCDETVTPGAVTPCEWYSSANVLQGGDTGSSSTTETASSHTVTLRIQNDSYDEISLLAKSRSGADGWNDYRLSGPGHLADIVAAGSTGVLLTERNCASFSGIPCGLEVWMTCVDNGNYSYTFSFFTKEPDTVEETFVADLVSGTNRVDMKPLLEHIGGKIEMRPSGELVPMTIYDGASEPVFPIVDLHGGVEFAATAEDLLNGTNLRPPTTDYIEAGAYVACFSATPVHRDASGPAFYQLAFGVYTSFDDENSVAYVPDFGGDISNPDFTYYSLDTLLAAGASGVPTIGMDTQTSETIESPYRIRASQVDNCYVFEIVSSSATVPTLCLEPSCDPCIDLSPLLSSTLGSVRGSFSCDSLISDSISFGVYYDGQSVGTSQDADFGGSFTIGRSNVSSFCLHAVVSSRNETHLFYFSGSSTSDTITFASLSVGSEVTLAPRSTVPSGFPAEIRLVVTAIPGTNQATFEVQDSREPMPTLTLTSTQRSGTATEQSIDMSCLTDIIGDTSVSGELFCGGLRNHGIRSVRLKCYDSNDTLLSNVSATINSDGTFTATLPAGCDHFTVHYVESGTQPQYYEADIIASELAVGYAACDIRSGGEEM